MDVEYIGFKPRKVDNVAGTGVVWNGPGDVQDVPISAASLLLRHGEVWAAAQRVIAQVQQEPVGIQTQAMAVSQSGAAGAASASGGQAEQGAGEVTGAGDTKISSGQATQPFVFTVEGTTVDLGPMNEDELKAFVRANELDDKVDLRKKGDNLRAAIVTAVKAILATAEAAEQKG